MGIVCNVNLKARCVHKQTTSKPTDILMLFSTYLLAVFPDEHHPSHEICVVKISDCHVSFLGSLILDNSTTLGAPSWLLEEVDVLDIAGLQIFHGVGVDEGGCDIGCEHARLRSQHRDEKNIGKYKPPFGKLLLFQM